MEESHVTVDGTRYDTGRPFMVVATQNPIEQAGTYRLPEAQLDRFLMKASVGYPERSAMIQILAGASHPDRTKTLRPIIATSAVADMADMIAENSVAESVLDYVHRLAEHTRDNDDTILGVSTRGAIGMVRAAKVWAGAHGRNYVIPDDVKELASTVWTHRMVMSPDAEFSGATASQVIARALASIDAPVVRGATA